MQRWQAWLLGALTLGDQASSSCYPFKKLRDMVADPAAWKNVVDDHKTVEIHGPLGRYAPPELTLPLAAPTLRPWWTRSGSR